jgi:hypothetical protein
MQPASPNTFDPKQDLAMPIASEMQERVKPDEFAGMNERS